MATVDIVNGAEDFCSNLVAEYAETSTPPAGERDLKATQRLLREALARERTLRRERDQLLEQRVTVTKHFAGRDDAAIRVATLSSRQREIMGLILAGRPNKIIAADIGLSQRTVESHRASIMKKLGVSSLPALVRLVLAAEGSDEQLGNQIGYSVMSAGRVGVS